MATTTTTHPVESVEEASLLFGMFLGVFIFTIIKIIDQTQSIWRRTQSFHNAYLYCIWVEVTVNFIWALITYLYYCGRLAGNLAFFSITVTLWAFQTQLLPQIIANRLSLIMTNKRKARNLKIGLAVFIGCVNIAVSYIWVNAQLPTASTFQVNFNHWSERCEKSFFLLIDLALNLYFLYVVRYRLIEEGLSKYWRLFKFNAGMVCISTSMDAMLLGFLQLPDRYIYIQYAPLAYIVKLYIELQMAVLISKVVRSGASGRNDMFGGGSSNQGNYGTSRVVITSNAVRKLHDDGLGREGSTRSDVYLNTYHGEDGIVKTVETTVVLDAAEDSQSDTV